MRKVKYEIRRHWARWLSTKLYELEGYLKRSVENYKSIHSYKANYFLSVRQGSIILDYDAAT